MKPPRWSHRKPRVLLGASPPPPYHGVASVVDVLLRSPRLQADFDLSFLEIRKHRGKHLDNRLDLVNLGYSLRQAGDLGRLLLRRRPDLIHFHTTHTWGFRKNAVSLWQAKAAGCAVLLQIHGAQFDTYYQRASSLEKKGIRATLQAADKVVVSSPGWREFCSQIVDRGKIQVIPNAVNWEFVPFLDHPPPRHRENREPVTVLFLGSLGQRKGTFDVLQAIPTVVQANPRVRFVLAGKEEKQGEWAQIQAVCAANHLYPCVTFLQPTQDEILDVYQQADIYTLPSYADAFPVALLEAMSASLPVVSSFTGGIPEILDGEAGGILIQPGDVCGLAQELLRLAASPSLRMKLGEANRRRIVERYSPKTVTRQVGELYESLLGRA